MNTNDTLCKRKELRFKTCDGQALQCNAIVDGEVTPEDDPHQGTVIDISPSGLRFLCDGKFTVGQEFSAELKTDRSYGMFRGIIRRVEPWLDGSILGCQLLDEIPNAVLEELALEGVVNRRNDDRVDWNQQAKLSWELEPGEIDIEINDCSPGGLKVTCEKAIPDTVRVRIRIDMGDDEPMVVDAKRVWQLKEEHGCVAGLAFTKRHVPEAVSRVLDKNSSDVEEEDGAHGSVIRRTLLLAAAVSVFGLALLQTGLWR